MALNKNLEEKITAKAGEDQIACDAMLKMLRAVDEGKQLKRVLEPILKTI